MEDDANEASTGLSELGNGVGTKVVESSLGVDDRVGTNDTEGRLSNLLQQGLLLGVGRGGVLTEHFGEALARREEANKLLEGEDTGTLEEADAVGIGDGRGGE